MAPQVQIRCINKTNRTDPHERISHVGGAPGADSPRWKWPTDRAIQAIETNEFEFFVEVRGNKVKVIVASRNGRKYLKTENDGEHPNNLLSLPECPA